LSLAKKLQTGSAKTFLENGESPKETFAKHATDKCAPCALSSAEQLLSGFFTEVNRVLKEVTK
tara:strand:- start:809 stop:997 length:189 start_codon:yes stop_codon:yes gene_type:complete